MSYKSPGSIPLYKKALDLCSMSREIASYVSYNKDLLKLYQSDSLRDHIADSLLTDAILIPQQIAQAESSGSLAVRIKSASFVNVMIRNIISYCNGLEKDGVKETEYLNLLRREIRSFRKSFKVWRKSISNGRTDLSWGFNDYMGY
ncbi:MAG: TIGR03643 family protein [Eudoraea sp.]|nr:TIGR03643 family protein [Eudoraea sp.]